MKNWNAPEILDLNITETANHQMGNNHGKMCIYDGSQPCNAQGNGKGICRNCVLNPSSSNSSNGSGFDGDVELSS